uniref:Secreted protein n=1 Tax=Timema genevievae TaxID=629358 RepID=A0A7R9JZ43_TIMGE|nr:unnamed protein product [Timema genevievae]
MCGAVLVALTSTWTGMGCCRCKANTAKSVHADEIVPYTLDARVSTREALARSVDTSAATVGRRRPGGGATGDTVMAGTHTVITTRPSRRAPPPPTTPAAHPTPARTRLPSLFFTPTLYSSNNKMPEDEWRMGWLIVPHGRGEEGRSYFWKRDSFYFGRFEHFVCREFLTAPLVALVVAGARMVARCRRLST